MKVWVLCIKKGCVSVLTQPLVFYVLNWFLLEKSQCVVNMEEIGKIIKERRKSLKVNQLELSKLAGVGINTLVAIERGEGNPKLETLLSILDTLGLQMTIGLKS